MILVYFSEMKEDKNMLVVDSGSSHTILKDKRYFVNLTLRSANINTIAGTASLIEGKVVECGIIV